MPRKRTRPSLQLSDLSPHDQAQVRMFGRFLNEAGSYQNRSCLPPGQRPALSPEVLDWALGRADTDHLPVEAE